MELINAASAIVGILSFLWGVVTFFSEDRKRKKLQACAAFAVVCVCIYHLSTQLFNLEMPWLELDAEIKTQSQILAENPNDKAALLKRGNAYLKKGDNEKALADFTSLVRTDPEDPVGHYARGTAHYTMRRERWAKDDFTEAISADPDCVDAYIARACAAWALSFNKTSDDEHENAIADLATAIRKRPRDAFAYSLLGHICLDLGRISDALEYYEAALAIEPGHWQALSGLAFIKGAGRFVAGETLHGHGAPKEATEYALSAREITRGREWLPQFLLALAYAGGGRGSCYDTMDDAIPLAKTVYQRNLSSRIRKSFVVGDREYIEFHPGHPTWRDLVEPSVRLPEIPYATSR